MKWSDRSFAPIIQNNYMCLFDDTENFTDLLVSKVYIFRNESAIFCQDPGYTKIAGDDDKLRYIIGVRGMDDLQPICAMIQKLRESNHIQITRVYSPELYLEENEILAATNNEISVLEGWLILDIFEDRGRMLFGLIEEISKFQTIVLHELWILLLCCCDHRRYFERILNLVSFSKNMKSLNIVNNWFGVLNNDHMLSCSPHNHMMPNSVIKRIAAELYSSQRLEGSELKKACMQLNAEGSSLKTLRVHITNEDLKILIRPNLLTQLQTLELTKLDAAETFREILGSGYPLLEKLSLFGLTLKKTDFLVLAATLVKDGLPKLKYLDVIQTTVHKESECSRAISSEALETICTVQNPLIHKENSEHLALKHFYLSSSSIGSNELNALLHAKQLNYLIVLELLSVTLTGGVDNLLGPSAPCRNITNF